jgi:hypothetical protein
MISVSVFFAVSGRPKMFQQALQSLKETTFGYDIETVAVIDNDPASARIAEHYDVDMIDYSPQKRGALWAWNRALSFTEGYLLVPAGDDQLFYKNWLKHAIESHRTRVEGYGVVGMNDLAYNGNTQLATMFLFDRAYCKEVMGGTFAPPMYHYYNIDSEWNEKAKMLGKFYWDERSKVEHLHSAHGKRPVDALDLEKQYAGWMEVDNRTFEDRKARGFPIEWESLI